MTIETTNKKLSSSKKFLLICFLLFTTLISIFGFGFYYYQKQTVIEAAKTNLSNLADLKAHQIGHWRHERISRAHLLSTNKLFLHSVQHYIEHQDNTSRENIIQALLPALGQNNLNGDHGVLITDHLGQTLLHVGESADWSRRSDKQKIAIIRQNGKPLFSKIYLDQITSESCQRNCDAPFKPHLHMDLTVPLYDNNKLTTMMGSIIFIIDPNTFLLPLVGLWPTSSISAESVLVRKIDDKVIRLTPLRHNNGEEPLVTIKPPKGIDTPGKHIKDGECGVIDGYDYRQKKVFAAIQKVPDSPWYIVTKIDQSEVLSFMTKLGAIIFASAISIVIAVGMIMWLWWRRQQAISRALHYEQELQNRTILSRFDNLTRHSNDIIVLCSEEGDIIDANQRALEAYGQPLETLRTHKLCSMCDIGDNGCNLLWQQLSANGETKFDSHQFRRDGSTFPVEINATWIKVGERKLLQAIIRDVSERKEAAQQLLHQAQHDPLTGLPNRTLITDRLHQAIGKCKRHDNQLALLFLDLDRFKNINDTLGHAAGDQLLVNIAQRIKKSLREVDTVARFGGDEFMILVEDITNIADIATLALKLIDAIEQPIFLGQQEIYVTTSTGITVAPDDSDNTEELIRFVETAMYRAKERGRNNYQFYTSDMNAHTHEHLKLETSLRKALANKEFVVHYQPQVELSSGKIIGSEALVRWQHPERGLVPPNDFIPLAEETGLITEIGLWVLEQACRQNLEWQAAGFNDLSVAVNLSARQFLDKNLQRDVFDILQRTNFNPKNLELEITESLSMFDVNTSISIMDSFTNKGISISIDDFGSGYSSLSHLHLFPIDKLKIDRSFINLIGSNNNDSLIPTIIALAEQLNLRVIAEGVETADQLEKLRQLKCQMVQGYYFSKPLPANEFSALLHQTAKDLTN